MHAFDRSLVQDDAVGIGKIPRKISSGDQLDPHCLGIIVGGGDSREQDRLFNRRATLPLPAVIVAEELRWWRIALGNGNDGACPEQHISDNIKSLSDIVGPVYGDQPFIIESDRLILSKLYLPINHNR